MADGVVVDGKGIDGVLDCMGTQPRTGAKGSVQIGPCCPETKTPGKTMAVSL